MPVPYLKKLSKKTHKPLSWWESKWKNAKSRHGENWKAIVGTMKKISKNKKKSIKEDISDKINKVSKGVEGQGIGGPDYVGGPTSSVWTTSKEGKGYFQGYIDPTKKKFDNDSPNANYNSEQNKLTPLDKNTIHPRQDMEIKDYKKENDDITKGMNKRLKKEIGSYLIKEKCDGGKGPNPVKKGGLDAGPNLELGTVEEEGGIVSPSVASNGPQSMEECGITNKKMKRVNEDFKVRLGFVFGSK